MSAGTEDSLNEIAVLAGEIGSATPDRHAFSDLCGCVGHAADNFGHVGLVEDVNGLSGNDGE